MSKSILICITTNAPDNMSENWTKVAATGDVDEDEVLQVKVGDKLLAIYNLDGKFHATSDICTHEYACLSDGFVVNGVIECPLHQGCFDIATGKAQGPPVEVDLETFRTRLDGDDIYVMVEPTK